MTLKLNLEAVAKDIVSQLKDIVPVYTGRLKNGIQYKIEKTGNDYWIYLILEDYFAYLKPRTTTPRLPSPRQLAMARPPLPKMNDIGKIKIDRLSPRAQGLLKSVDVESAFEKLDMKAVEDEIRKILVYDKSN